MSRTRPPETDAEYVAWLGLVEAASRRWSSQEDGDYLTWLGLLNRIENSPRVIDFVCHECGALRTAPASWSVPPACCGERMVDLFHTLRPRPEFCAWPPAVDESERPPRVATPALVVANGDRPVLVGFDFGLLAELGRSARASDAGASAHERPERPVWIERPQLQVPVDLSLAR